MAKELETSGTDDAGKWWFVSTSADLLIKDAGPSRNCEYSAISLAMRPIEINRRRGNPTSSAAAGCDGGRGQTAPSTAVNGKVSEDDDVRRLMRSDGSRRSVPPSTL